MSNRRPTMFTPRYAAALALLALAPLALYTLARGQDVVVLSAVSVLLIAGSLYLAFGPAAGEDHEARA